LNQCPNQVRDCERFLESGGGVRRCSALVPESSCGVRRCSACTSLFGVRRCSACVAVRRASLFGMCVAVWHVRRGSACTSRFGMYVAVRHVRRCSACTSLFGMYIAVRHVHRCSACTSLFSMYIAVRRLAPESRVAQLRVKRPASQTDAPVVAFVSAPRRKSPVVAFISAPRRKSSPLSSPSIVIAVAARRLVDGLGGAGVALWGLGWEVSRRIAWRGEVRAGESRRGCLFGVWV